LTAHREEGRDQDGQKMLYAKLSADTSRIGLPEVADAIVRLASKHASFVALLPKEGQSNAL
jgi:hypothetical protein